MIAQPNQPLNPIRLAFTLLLITCSTNAHAQLEWCDTPYTENRLTIDTEPNTDVIYGPISLSGDTAVIGAYIDNIPAVFIYLRNNDNWELQQTLFSDSSDYTGFGQSVSIDGDTIVVGAPDDVRYEDFYGVAHVYTRTQGLWQQQAILGGPFENDHIGFAQKVDINGDNIIINVENSCNDEFCSPAAHIYTRSKGQWVHAAMLTPQDRDSPYDFASSIAISGNTAVVNIDTRSQGSPDYPMANVYTFTDGQWILESSLIANDPQNIHSDISLDIEGDTIILGSRFYYNFDNIYDGAALIFTRADGLWNHQTSLSSNDILFDEEFGLHVALDGNHALVMSHSDDQPAVILFEINDDQWTQITLFRPDPEPYYDRYRSTMALSNDQMIIDFGIEDDEYDHSPYALTLFCDTTCYVDLQENGTLDFYDFSIFRDAFVAHDPLADFYPDGNIDLFDIFAYMIAFNRGCYTP